MLYTCGDVRSPNGMQVTEVKGQKTGCVCRFSTGFLKICTFPAYTGLLMLKKLLSSLLYSISYYYTYTSLLHHPSRRDMMGSYVMQFNEEERTFLERAAKSINYVIDYSLGMRQRDQYLLTLNDVTFLGNSGAVVKNGAVVVESVMEVNRLGKSTAFKTPALMLPNKKSGLYTSVLHLPLSKTSNYHWFFDCLPRLYFVLQQVKKPIKIIMRSDLPAFQHQTLQFILQDHPHAELVYIGEHEKWEVEQFILPSFMANSQSAYLPIEVCNWMQQKIWNGYNNERTNPRRRIYISRAIAKKRRVLNEEAFLPILMQYGFEIVKAEELNYQQQVQLFYDAETVVAPHGAGLTNLLFSRDCKVLEFHPANLVKTHYFLLCKGLGFEYTPLVGSEGDAKENYTVDVLAVEHWLQKL